jgi:hypothetical protein
MSDPSNPFGAVASTLGYLYQCRYGLLLLLERAQKDPAVELSIERFDDITIEQSGVPTEQRQLKHHLSRSGDLTNASVDLWKTLRIWSEGIHNGILRPSDTLLYIVTTASAPEGSAASKLRHDKRDVASALKTLLGVTQSSTNASNTLAYAAFNALTPSQQEGLLAAVRVLDHEPNIDEVLPRIRELLTYACRPEHLDHLVERLEGWWQGVVVQHLTGGVDGSQPTLRGFDLQTKINDIRDELRRDNLPTDFCFANIDIPVNLARDGRNFVRQLRVIGHREDVISNAVCDHYRSFGQRSEWIRKDLALVEELEQYDSRLIREWKVEFAFLAEELTDSTDAEAEKKAGRGLYRWSQRLEIHIRRDCTEPTISRGSFHLLADDLRVGWHPRFQAVMEAGGGACEGNDGDNNRDGVTPEGGSEI